MARIRSIKPEFPQSESMGNVSRDARLLFVLLWTVADDAGITRGNSRMLASLLFPYDNDAPSLIDGWMEELENENCIARYKHDGSSYLQILNWLNHQKIDKPTQSKLPSFESSREDSRILTVGEEGKGVERKGIGEEGMAPSSDGAGEKAEPSRTHRATRLPDDWVLKASLGNWALEQNPGWGNDDVLRIAEKFKNHWLAKAGKDARKICWDATWRTWVMNEIDFAKRRAA